MKIRTRGQCNSSVLLCTRRSKSPHGAQIPERMNGEYELTLVSTDGVNTVDERKSASMTVACICCFGLSTQPTASSLRPSFSSSPINELIA